MPEEKIKVYVEMTAGKVVSVFGSPQSVDNISGYAELTADDPLYLEYKEALPEHLSVGLA